MGCYRTCCGCAAGICAPASHCCGRALRGSSSDQRAGQGPCKARSRSVRATVSREPAISRGCRMMCGNHAPELPICHGSGRPASSPHGADRMEGARRDFSVCASATVVRDLQGKTDTPQNGASRDETHQWRKIAVAPSISGHLSGFRAHRAAVRGATVCHGPEMAHQRP